MTGLHHLTMAEYQAAPGVSRSMLSELRRSPAHLKAYIDSPRPEPTPQMEFGTLVHHAILEPDDFLSRHCVTPDCDKRTKEYKAFKAELKPDQVIVTADEKTKILKMIDAVRYCDFGKQLFADTTCEVSIFTEDGRKARMDILPQSMAFLADVKTTADASKAAFSKSLINYDYHMQAAFYLDSAAMHYGQAFDVFLFIAVEKEPPYAVAFYQLDAAGIDQGRKEYMALMERYRECVATSSWPGYGEREQLISLPRWASNREDVA